jgi:hypothetical protein
MPCTNLYRIITREDVYQENQEHFVDLTNHPNVDGIFELQVQNKARPSMLSLIMATVTGTVGHPRHSKVRKNMHSSR